MLSMSCVMMTSTCNAWPKVKDLAALLTVGDYLSMFFVFFVALSSSSDDGFLRFEFFPLSVKWRFFVCWQKGEADLKFEYSVPQYPD